MAKSKRPAKKALSTTSTGENRSISKRPCHSDFREFLAGKGILPEVEVLALFRVSPRCYNLILNYRTDPRTHGADADALAAEASEGGGGFGIKREYHPPGEEVHALDELLIGENALVRIKGAVGAGQYAAKFLFQRDDRGEYLCPGLQETTPESLAKWSGIGKFLEVIGIEQEHRRVSLSRSAATLLRVGPLRVKMRRLAMCRQF